MIQNYDFFLKLIRSGMFFYDSAQGVPREGIRQGGRMADVSAAGRMAFLQDSFEMSSRSARVDFEMKHKKRKNEKKCFPILDFYPYFSFETGVLY